MVASVDTDSWTLTNNKLIWRPKRPWRKFWKRDHLFFVLGIEPRATHMLRKRSSIRLHTKPLFTFISWQSLTKLLTLPLNSAFSGNRVSRSWHYESASPGLFGFYAMQKCALKEGKLECSGVMNMERKQQTWHCKEVVQEWGLHTQAEL